MNLLSFNKRAQFQNYSAAIAVLFMFGFMSIFGYYLLQQFLTTYQATGTWTSEMATAGASFQTSMGMYDYIVPLIAIVLIIAVGLTNWKLRAHPAFFIISIIEITFFGMVSYFFNFVFVQLASQSVFAATLLFFPMTMMICTNMHWIALAIFIVGSITLYAKNPGQESGGLIQ